MTTSKVACAGLLVLLVIGMAACGKKDATDDKADTASTERPAKQRAKAKVATSAPAEPAAGDADPAKPEIRFDMTQDGKAMTADQFDAWMDAQGVRVVKAGAAPAAAIDGSVAKAAPAAATAAPSKD